MTSPVVVSPPLSEVPSSLVVGVVSSPTPSPPAGTVGSAEALVSVLLLLVLLILLELLELLLLVAVSVGVVAVSVSVGRTAGSVVEAVGKALAVTFTDGGSSWTVTRSQPSSPVDPSLPSDRTPSQMPNCDLAPPA